MHRPHRVVVLALLAALLAGCSGGDDSGSGSAGDEAAAPSVAGLNEAGDQDAAGGGAETAPGEPATTLASVDPLGSALIRTAEIGVRVDEVRAAADAAARLVRDAGGSVASERTDAARADDVADAELRLRVPPDRFDEVLSRLAALGDERVRSISTEEVGDQLVDLESRLATQRASVERVRALLEEAQNLGEVVAIEGELTRRTADLESLEARRAALGDQVQMATVVLRLDSDDAGLAAGTPGFFDGLQGGWTALVASAQVLATVTGALLPFVPLVLAGLWVTARVRRRRQDAGAAGSAAVVPGG